MGMTLEEYAEKMGLDKAEEPTAADARDALYRRNTEREEAKQRTAAIYQEYQQNTIATAGLTADILKGLKAGEDTAKLLLLAVKGLSMLTHDRLLYDQTEADLLSIYGYGLKEPGAAAMTAAAVRGRLGRLEESARNEVVPPEDKRRIEKAITAHRRQLSYLEAQ